MTEQIFWLINKDVRRFCCTTYEYHYYTLIVLETINFCSLLQVFVYHLYLDNTYNI